ncbi:hypothetical protein ACFX13_046815 [Malus domestica]
MDFKKSVSNEKANETTYISKAAIRKEMRIKRMAREGIRAWVVELRSQKALLPRALIECTINPGENEAVVRYALDTYKLLSLAPQHPRIGGPDLVGRLEFPDGYTEEWLRPRGGRTLFVLYLGPPYLDLVQILEGT